MEAELSFEGRGFQPSDPMPSPGQKVNILLVDDSAECLLAWQEVLAGPDRHLVMVQSGEEALRYLLAADVGVILLDIRLSGLSGYETASLIRQRSRTRTVPIIFVTGYSKEDTDVARGYAFGAVDFIFKPADPHVLRSKVACFVELAKHTQSLRSQTAAWERSEKDFLRSHAAAALIEQAPLPAFLSDAQCVVVQANAAASELLGLQLNHPIGLSASAVLTPGERWTLTGAVRETAERGVRREIVVHPVRDSGGPMSLALHLSPLRDQQGRLLGVMAIGQDVRLGEQALLDLERMRSVVERQANDLARLKEIVVARDLSLLRLQQETEVLKQQRGAEHKYLLPDPSKETNDETGL
ncbi:response regulator [Candidatus Nitrospira bockiana]